MLVVCNGAIKSGSTWLYNILVNLVEVQWPDRGYLTENSRKNPCIRPDKLDEFLRTEDFRGTNYISKNHLGKARYRELLLSHPEVYVFDIERDARDVVVSAYYDEKNRHGYEGSFETFYWTFGREIAAELGLYHALWREAGERTYVASYERLQSDFASEARAIAKVLGLELDDAAVEQLHQNTSMDKLRKEYSGDPLYKGNQFFRKGIVGDWKNHFDDRMLADMERVQQHGCRTLDWAKLVWRGRRLLGAGRA